MEKESTERIPQSPPSIAPLPPGMQRPLWSVMIPTYNATGYLEEAIKSVLVQDLGSDMMQIEVIDDCSTDADVASLVDKLGAGRITYFRQSHNVGSIRNFETCINRAKGKYVHLLHADDRVKKDFYITIQGLFEKHPDIGAAFCRWDYIDEKGIRTGPRKIETHNDGLIENALFKLAQYQMMQYVAMVVKREVYEKLGSFYAVKYGEDWEMWARISKTYDIGYTPQILAEYREHTNSISGASFQTADNLNDIAKVFTIINSYLPPQFRKRYYRNAKSNYAYWASQRAFGQWRLGKDKKEVYRQLRGILNFHTDRRLIQASLVSIFKIQVKFLLNAFKRKSGQA